MELVFTNQVPRTARIPRAALLRAARRAQTLFGRELGNRTVGVVFVSRAASKKLNRAYRGKNKPTNVLSFPARAPGELGDIIIAPEIARAESREQDSGFSAYVAFLFAHGLLHLLGHTHESERAERIMEHSTAQILNTK